MKTKQFLLLTFTTFFLLSGCNSIKVPITPTGIIATTMTRVQNTSTPVPTLTLAPTKIPVIRFALAEAVPAELHALINLNPQYVQEADPKTSDIVLDVVPTRSEAISRWIYAVVAPFPTVEDSVTFADIKNAWSGNPSGPFQAQPLMMTPDEIAAFTETWGPPSEINIQVVENSSIEQTSWTNRPSWAIIPFESINPRWKVLKVDDQSPLDKHFNTENYPLIINFGFKGNPQLLERMTKDSVTIPPTNRDSTKLTTLVMTGTTALTRATAWEMDHRGIDFPAQDVGDLLRDADLTHISNEVSFWPLCGPGNMGLAVLQFCSDPSYIKLLEDIGVDIVELTGNHMNDYGPDPFVRTIQMYKDRNWYFFGGGLNEDAARQPIKTIHNGNKLAFIGCNEAGPIYVWATAEQAGAAKCDYPYITEQMKQLQADGFNVIMTFQYRESYTMRPVSWQVDDFMAMSTAGAVIVSGSQAHFPQGMAFNNNRFVHFGLGNLFFDQMDTPVIGTRRATIDRHIFYDNHYIGTELITTMLEDYARPRNMTNDERRQFLKDLFRASGW